MRTWREVRNIAILLRSLLIQIILSTIWNVNVKRVWCDLWFINQFLVY